MKTLEGKTATESSGGCSECSPLANRLRVSTSFSISLFLFAGGILELLKNSAIAYRYGSGAETDAFFAAYLIPSTYAMFWVSSCLVGIVPLLAARLKQGERAVSHLVGTTVVLSAASTLVLASVGYLAAPPLMTALVPGFTAAQRSEAISLFRQLAPLFVLVGLTGVASAVLNSQRKFLLPAAQKLAVNTVVLAGLLVWFAGTGTDWLAKLIVWGTLLYAMLLLLRMYLSGLRPKFERSSGRWEIRDVLVAVFVPFAALTIRQSSMLAERAIASLLPPGSISALSYAYQVIMGFGAVVVAGVTTALMPMLAQQDSNIGKIRLVQQGLYYLLVAVMPLAFGVCLLARPLVLILFRHGAFSEASAVETTRIFHAYAFAIIFVTIAMLFQAPLWADRRYRLVISHNGLMAVLNVLLDLALVPFLGITGLALGYTLTSATSSLRLLRLLDRNYGRLLTERELLAALKPLLATLVMVIVVGAIRMPVSSLVATRASQFSNEIFTVAILSAAGAVTYVAGGIAARMEPFPTLYRQIRGRLAAIWEDGGSV